MRFEYKDKSRDRLDVVAEACGETAPYSEYMVGRCGHSDDEMLLNLNMSNIESLLIQAAGRTGRYASDILVDIKSLEKRIAEETEDFDYYIGFSDCGIYSNEEIEKSYWFTGYYRTRYCIEVRYEPWLVGRKGRRIKVSLVRLSLDCTHNYETAVAV